MFQIIIANQDKHTQPIRELFWEYLQWANAKVEENFGVSFDIVTMLEEDMNTLGNFMPPKGRLLLGYVEDQPMGIACLKALVNSISEAKRMYVRPQARKRGLGRALLNQLLEEASHIGYERIRLDSARFMTEAHQLYRTSGFREIEAYEGSEIPNEFQSHWISWNGICRGGHELNHLPDLISRQFRPMALLRLQLDQNLLGAT